MNRVLLLGATGTGLFRAGTRFAGAVYELIYEPTKLQAWSTLKTAQCASEQAMRVDAAGRLIVQQATIAVPLLLGLALTSKLVVSCLLGAQWSGAAPVLLLMSLALLVQSPEALSEPLLVMSGRVDVVSRLSFFSVAVALILLAVFAPLGLLWVAVGQLMASCVVLAANAWVLRRTAALPWRRIGRDLVPVLVAAVAMSGMVTTLGAILPARLPDWLRLSIQVVGSGCTYLTVIATIAPGRMADLYFVRRRAECP